MVTQGGTVTDAAPNAHGMDDGAWLRALAGRFIVFEGADGSGKTTQFNRLLADARRAGLDVCEVREPGGTPVGERIREILLDPVHDEMALRCEMLLYMASRAQLVEQRIRPALAAGQLVAADRYVSSTLVYQGAAGGLDVEEIMAVARVACGRAWPDQVIIFDVDERTAAQRLNPLLDRMEQKGAAFHEKVRRGYLELAAREPDRHMIIDARTDADAVYATVVRKLRERFGG